MIFPRLERQPDGGLAFENLTAPYVMVLVEVPEFLGPDPPDPVRQRLYPDPGDNEQVRADWEKYIRPELYALIASAREIVMKDLSGLGPSKQATAPGVWRLEIPAKHINAWISALNGARLALGALHGIEEDSDLHPERKEPIENESEDSESDSEPFDECDIAIVKIHMLGDPQAMLVMDQNPAPEGFGDEDEPED